jgi:hypothetical protein
MNDGARSFVQELAIETGVPAVVVVHLRGWVVRHVPPATPLPPVRSLRADNT